MSDWTYPAHHVVGMDPDDILEAVAGIGAEPNVVRVVCEGRTHRVVIHHDHLELCDHDDVEAELALSVLGGQPNGCLSMLRNWRLLSAIRARVGVSIGDDAADFLDETRC